MALDDNPHIVILGAGFAALTGVRELRRRLPRARITVLAPKAEFVYLPSLIWLPAGIRHGEDLKVPLEPFFNRHDVVFLAGAVTGLADAGRTVLWAAADGGEIRQLNNDGLLIATGGRFLKGLPGIEHALTLCEGIASAERIAERLKDMPGGDIAFGFGGNPKEPAAMRGGPMFELLFGIDTLLRQQGRRERFKLHFFNAAAEPGKRLGSKAVARLLAEMKRRNISTYLGDKILGFTDHEVKTATATIPADLILFMPGLTGPAWANEAGTTLSEGGFFPADEYCAVRGMSHVYVAGDAGSYPGPDWMPKQAHMANLQARASAENLCRSLAGQAPCAKPRIEMICIVDTLNAGMLVYRDQKRNWLLPSWQGFHWAKRYFESHYLRSLQ